MEYDNDRIRKHTGKEEFVYWTLFILINPLVNSVTLFFTDIQTGILLLLVNLAAFPAYLFYSRAMGPVFLIPKRRAFLVLLSLFSVLVMVTFLWALYSLILQFPLTPAAQTYFTFHSGTILREILWVIIQLGLAMAIFFIKKAVDEKDILSLMRKENNFFKLQVLRAQLNPHFLFNTLNSIYSLSLQKSDQTPEVIIKLADIMRYLIYECNEERIPIHKEIEFIRNYVEIEKVRYKADIRFTVEGETDNIFIEPFLFISFIENGFKHAMDSSFAEPIIYITLKVGSGQIVLNVINSTNSNLETQAKRINGKGISNSRSLLELLYPDSYELDIIQTEKEETRKSSLRIRNAKERLETLYPDSHTLDVILNKNFFTVSLILKPRFV
ncbi:sensor histidine kinase [Flavitalea flava]